MNLTPVEQKARYVLDLALQYLTSTERVPKRDYVNLLAHIRHALTSLENKNMGCASGRHTDYCLCTEGHPSGGIKYTKWPRKKKK